MARRQREIRFKFKYAVLGEGITEQYYLTHLKELMGYKYSIRPKLFQDIGIEKAEGIIDELLSGGCDHISYLTDYDTNVNQGKKAEFDKLIKKYAEVEEVLICDSMPSIEYWFLLHFTYTTKEFVNCEEVLRDLKRYIPDYAKKKTYLEKEKWFKDALDLISNTNEFYDETIFTFFRRNKKLLTSEAEQYFLNRIDKNMANTGDSYYSRIAETVVQIKQINPKLAEEIVTDIRTNYKRRTKLMGMLRQF